MSQLTELQQALTEQISEITAASIHIGELSIEVAPKDWFQIAERLRDEFSFKLLIDVTAVDYSSYGETNWATNESSNSGFSRGVFERFEDDKAIQQNKHQQRFCMVYHLLDIDNNRRLRVKVYLEDNEYPSVCSIEEIWSTANWFEREVFDLFGILFENHSDLRRILTDYGFSGHPLRKDFPLVGEVEMTYDETKKQVVYQPVSIENRVNTPRVIRNDH